MPAFFRRHPDALVPAFLLALGLLAILGAWTSQLVFGFVPCKLCLEQRIPYYVGLPVVLAALLTAGLDAQSRLTRTLLGIAGLVFAVNVYIASYHAGVEWKWWPGPADCGGGASGPVTTTQDLLNQLDGIRIVSCTEAAFRFLGLSFAGWNAIVSLILVVAAFFGALRGSRRAMVTAAQA